MALGQKLETRQPEKKIKNMGNMQMRRMQIGDRIIGEGQPCCIIAEIGINHGGSLDTAKELMEAAFAAGADACKFQKRTEMKKLVPEHKWHEPKLTPWGETLPYLEYREKMEFNLEEWGIIFELGRSLGIHVFSSVWDRASVDWLENNFPDDLAAIKIPSAHLTNEPLLHQAATRGKPVLLSAGMSTIEEVQQATERMGNFGTRDWALLHCHSAYPAPIEELNLRVIDTWLHTGALSQIPIGYSGHEVGLSTSVAAVALGASILERHITLDRASVGSDHAASIEPGGFARLVKDVRAVESALGTGKKIVWPSEEEAKERLRP